MIGNVLDPSGRHLTNKPLKTKTYTQKYHQDITTRAKEKGFNIK